MGRALMSKPEAHAGRAVHGPGTDARRRIFDIIRDLHQAGHHDPARRAERARWRSIADRAYVLETGKITMSGGAQDLLHDDKVRKAYLGG